MNLSEIIRTGGTHEQMLEYIRTMVEKINIQSHFRRLDILTAQSFSIKRRDKEGSDEEKSFISDLLMFEGELCRHLDPESNQFITLCPQCLIENKTYLFLDREKFKTIVQKCIEDPGAQFLFVDGEPKSGLSYLVNYLYHLNWRNGIYEVKEFDFDTELTQDGYDFISVLSKKLGVKINNDEKTYDKMETLITAFKEKLETSKYVPIIFMHNFHKHKVIKEEIYRCISRLLEEFRQMRKHKVILIAAGIDTEKIVKWEIIERYTTQYTIEPITDKDFEKGVRCLYDDLFLKIQKDEFISYDSFFYKAKEECGLPNIDINKIGGILNRQVLQFKQLLNHE